MAKISKECLEYLLKEGFDQSSIARICNVTRQAVSYRIHYVKKKDPEILRRRAGVIIMRRLGFKWKEIGNTFGITDTGAITIFMKHQKGEYK